MKLLTLAMVLVASLATGDDVKKWGRERQASHFVSVAELIGRPEFFDGQPVSVVGFVEFPTVLQPASRLYATQADFENAMPAAIAIEVLSDRLGMTEADQARLLGKAVLIEGTFHMKKRPRLKRGQHPTICFYDCALAGELTDVELIMVWPHARPT